jgi:hypothetical protein
MKRDTHPISKAIREDVAQQISNFVESFRRTFDPDAYPHIDDGEIFDRELARLKQDFSRLERIFHDYLLAAWSKEASDSMDHRPPS